MLRSATPGSPIYRSHKICLICAFAFRRSSVHPSGLSVLYFFRGKGAVFKLFISGSYIAIWIAWITILLVQIVPRYVKGRIFVCHCESHAVTLLQFRKCISFSDLRLAVQNILIYSTSADPGCCIQSQLLSASRSYPTMFSWLSFPFKNHNAYSKRKALLWQT